MLPSLPALETLDLLKNFHADRGLDTKFPTVRRWSTASPRFYHVALLSNKTFGSICGA
jgi:hypothetical protein